MMIYTFSHLTLRVDPQAAALTSLCLDGKERLVAPCPLFSARLRDADGAPVLLCAKDAGGCEITADGLIYRDFSVPGAQSVTATVRFSDADGACGVWVTLDPGSDALCPEWVDVLPLTLPTLAANALGGGRILFPYNEGVIVSDIAQRESEWCRSMQPEYPSSGAYPVFPNMVSSQLLAYLWEDDGLYLAVHDETRAPKGIDFYPEVGGVTLRFRLFCGCRMGQRYEMPAPLTLARCDGRWESAAERYRTWFADHLPPRAVKVSENAALPTWYHDLPLVVSYPVRGIHDMDEMTPNALFPYTNALPLLDDIRAATDSRLLVLLMHWEGTAPWAPPYVWPPFGGVESFNAFRAALHEKNDLMGVYCSGFGYTIQSNLIADYNMREEYECQGLEAGMCAGPDGKVAISHICTGQRSGYDVCPASPVGRALLDRAYTPLFEADLDYVQILDQNHGGGQYLCYSREHGHPDAPGAWMTTNMQGMLSDWNDAAPRTLFGCESAAAEPFIGNLLFSDNRFELDYHIGEPVPLYAYLYHEYLHNFMGNQCCCPLRSDVDTLCYRLAYSFTAGDCMTLVLTPDGKLMPNWGTRDFEHAPDKGKALELIRNLTRFYREEAAPYLGYGKMIPSMPIECERMTLPRYDARRNLTQDAVLSTAWQAPDGSRAQILVNPTDEAQRVRIGGRELVVEALQAVKVEIR